MSYPLPEDTTEYNSHFTLKKHNVFKFKVNSEGLYKISIKPTDSIYDQIHKLSCSLHPNHTDITFPLTVTLKGGEIDVMYLSGRHRTDYELTINQFDSKLKSIPVTVHVHEAAATASKNLYFEREFRPINKLIYSILLILSLVLGSVSAFIVGKERFLNKSIKNG